MFKKPSSTITSATVAMGLLTVFWEVLAQLGFDARPTLVSSSVLTLGSVVGYFWPERELEKQFRKKFSREADDPTLRGSQDA